MRRHYCAEYLRFETYRDRFLKPSQFQLFSRRAQPESARSALFPPPRPRRLMPRPHMDVPQQLAPVLNSCTSEATARIFPIRFLDSFSAPTNSSMANIWLQAQSPSAEKRAESRHRPRTKAVEKLPGNARVPVAPRRRRCAEGAIQRLARAER